MTKTTYTIKNDAALTEGIQFVKSTSKGVNSIISVSPSFSNTLKAATAIFNKEKTRATRFIDGTDWEAVIAYGQNIIVVDEMISDAFGGNLKTNTLSNARNQLAPQLNSDDLAPELKDAMRKFTNASKHIASLSDVELSEVLESDGSKLNAETLKASKYSTPNSLYTRIAKVRRDKKRAEDAKNNPGAETVSLSSIIEACVEKCKEAGYSQHEIAEAMLPHVQAMASEKHLKALSDVQKAHQKEIENMQAELRNRAKAIREVQNKKASANVSKINKASQAKTPQQREEHIAKLEAKEQSRLNAVQAMCGSA